MNRDEFKSELTRLAEQIVTESGDLGAFNVSAWIEEWIDLVNPALGFKPPSAFMNSEGDQEVIRSLIKRMQSGVYS